MGGDEAKQIIGNSWKQSQIQPLFDSADDYDKFIGSVTAENRMFNTRQAVLGGSQTAGRVAEDAGGHGGVGANAVQAVLDLAHGNLAGGAYAGARMFGNLAGIGKPSPAVNAQIAKLLFNPALNRDTLSQIAASQVRPNLIAPALTFPLATTASRFLPAMRQSPFSGDGTQ